MLSQSATLSCFSSTRSSQVVPHAPGLANVPSGLAQEKSGMIFLQGRAPAGVVDDDVEENTRAERMRGAGQFAKLVHAGGAVVEFDQRRVNRRQIETRHTDCRNGQTARKSSAWDAPAADEGCGSRGYERCAATGASRSRNLPEGGMTVKFFPSSGLSCASSFSSRVEGRFFVAPNSRVKAQ